MASEKTLNKNQQAMKNLRKKTLSPSDALLSRVSEETDEAKDENIEVEKPVEEPSKPEEIVEKTTEPDATKVEQKKLKEKAEQKKEVEHKSEPTNTSSVTSDNTEKTKNDRLKLLKSMQKKERVEDTHTRTTYLVRNELLKRIDKVSGNSHGFKIQFINFAIELALEEYEQMEED